MNVTIGLSKPKNDNLLSKIIRRTQKTPFSHTYIKYEDTSTCQIMIFEAVVWGVRKIELSQWLKLNEIVVEFDLNITKTQYTEFLSFANLNTHKRYGILQLIGIGLAKYLNLKRNLFDDEDRTDVCSELVARVLILFGYKIEIDLDLITPRHINDLLNIEMAKIGK
jgi:hypothetical protein